jgi:hypothetical protein
LSPKSGLGSKNGFGSKNYDVAWCEYSDKKRCTYGAMSTVSGGEETRRIRTNAREETISSEPQINQLTETEKCSETKPKMTDEKIAPTVTATETIDNMVERMLSGVLLFSKVLSALFPTVKK